MNKLQIGFVAAFIFINWLMLRECYLKLIEDDDSPIKMWMGIWRTRNVFGQICSALVILITIPAIIIFYIVVLFAALIYMIQYLGIKKGARNINDLKETK